MWKIKKKNRAFTLVELLIVASILGMVSLSILSSFASGLRVYERVQTFAQGQADILLAFEKMEQEIRSMVKIAGLQFRGDSTKMAFSGVSRSIDSEGKLNMSPGLISYYYDKEEQSLMREEIAYGYAIADKEPTSKKKRAVAEIEGLNLSYYHFDEKAKQYEWIDLWEKEDAIPKAIKVEVTFKDGEQERSISRTTFIETNWESVKE